MNDDTITVKDGVARGSSERASLVVLSGPDIGRIIRLVEPVTIGRAEEATVCIDEPGVSRQHAVIQPGRGRYLVLDRNSHNGTFLNGDPVRVSDLTFGDRIQVGSVVLEFARGDRLDDQLQHAQRMEALGRLAGGIAHDFNNLLAVVGGSLHLVRGEVRSPAGMECVADAVEALERMNVLTRQLLSYTGRGRLENRPIDVRALVEDVARHLSRTLPASIRVEVAGEAAATKGDPGELRQVLLNLALNARDAMPQGGVLRFEVGSDESATHISVRDTGVGMPTEVLQRATEPYFTTKQAGRGTGLGLAMVYGTITAHGGRLELNSIEGEGAEVRIQLPVAELPAHQRPRSSHAVGSGVVLVVDDDAIVLRTTLRLLTMAGFDVRSAKSGVEAMERLDADVDLVLLDVVMPDMDGADTWRAIRAERPDLPVIFCTGQADPQRIANLVDGDTTMLVRKPYRPDALIGLVADVLADRRNVSRRSAEPNGR